MLAIYIAIQAQVLAQWNTVYDAYNEVACLIVGSMTLEIHRQFEKSSPYDMIKELKSMFDKQAGVKRGYVEQVERLGYFAGFVRNYNMHNMGNTIGGRIQKANKKSLNAKGKDKGKGKRKDKPVYIPGIEYQEMDKIKAKRTNPSTGMKRGRKTKVE
ncbi:hypothetical protein Tco_0639744, partial [Tanacetum coccineum]